jgi:PAS domain S-box-containing protein
MTIDFDNKTDKNTPLFSSEYGIFESLKHPISIISHDGLIIYCNKAYSDIFQNGDKDIRLDWEQPFFPEYRKRMAQSYLAALHGMEKRCFAIVTSQNGSHIPLEIYLFPMFEGGSVRAILAFMLIVDDRLLSYEQSALSIASEENFQYDNLHLEFSPMPIVRLNEQMQVIRCSLSIQGFLGYSIEEILVDKSVNFETIFYPDADKVKKAASSMLAGELTFHRIGEVRISTRDNEKKNVNLTMYPIIHDKQIIAIEIIMEDITKIKELMKKINTGHMLGLFTDITKSFLHMLSNTVNVVLSKTQMLLQITEKESVIEGIQTVEESALEIARQVKRIQNFIGSAQESNEETTEPLVDIIEDAIEFSKMQFKVYSIDNTKNIEVEKKYFASVFVNTNTRLLREIITSIIHKVAGSIQRSGVIGITLKQNNDLVLTVEAEHAPNAGIPLTPPVFINIFSGIDIRQATDILNLKIIEEESPESFAIKAVFPSRMLAGKEKHEFDGAEYRLRNLDIIIVEDEIPLQKILLELFDKMGNHVFVCDDGRKAIEEFKKKNYDIVITDYGIPGITGIELSARIKEIREETITVLLSGWTLDNIKTYRNVVDLFLPKPFKLDVLLRQISKIMGEKKKY